MPIELIDSDSTYILYNSGTLATYGRLFQRKCQGALLHVWAHKSAAVKRVGLQMAGFGTAAGGTYPTPFSIMSFVLLESPLR